MPAVSSAAGIPSLSVELSPEMIGVLLQHAPSDAVARLAERVADVLAERRSPWLTAEQAAEHIAAPLSRVRKLTMTGELPHHRDGRRVLYRRDELDDFVRNGGARTP
jgi:excisionase family DNA binding protein